MTGKLIDGPAIAHLTGLHPVTLRRWARTGRLPVRGRGRHGRNLYDLDDVARILGWDDDTPECARPST